MVVNDPSPSSWVLTDVGERDATPVLVRGEELVPDAEIYYSFWTCEDVYLCEESDEVVVLSELNNAIRSASWDVVNPAVWRAAQQLAGYSAVFRTIKAEQPEAWMNFVASLPDTTVPAFATPNLIPRF